MSEILLTPLPEPISPVDPDMNFPRRAPSQSTEFFNSLYVEGVRGHTRPLQVRKKPATVNNPARSSTVSVPSSPTSFRSSESLSPPKIRLHPHQSISDMFMALDLHRNPSTSSRSELHLALGVNDQVKPGPSPPLTPLSPRRRKSSIPLTPITPVRPRRKIPGSPVTPTRAPSKAMKLLGTMPPALPPKQGRRKRDNFRPLPHSTLVEINQFFGNVPKKPTKTSKSDPTKSVTRVQDESRNVGGGNTVLHRGQDGQMWFDIEEEQEFAWLMSDPSVSRPRTKVPPSIAPTDDSEDETWGMKAFTSVLAQPSKPRKEKESKRVEDSFVDMFDKPKVRTRRQPAPSATPHPWSAAALAQDSTPATTPPALISRLASDSSSSSSGLSSPEYNREPPRRPKHRPPPLVLNLVPKAGLPVVCLNSPPPIPYIRKPKVEKPASPAQSRISIQTPFVHPRRAPKPRSSIGLGHPPLPRSTDTRMPLLPPLTIYMPEEEELEISCFEPVTPTEEKNFGHIRSGSAEKRGGWLKKVVRDLSHGTARSKFGMIDRLYVYCNNE